MGRREWNHNAFPQLWQERVRNELPRIWIQGRQAIRSWRMYLGRRARPRCLGQYCKGRANPLDLAISGGRRAPRIAGPRSAVKEWLAWAMDAVRQMKEGR